MFCEPRRDGWLVRATQATPTQNYPYLFASAVIAMPIFSGKSNHFREADALFAAKLSLMDILSILCHGSNALWSHYADLWAMDSCISFLIARISCQGAGFAAACLFQAAGVLRTTGLACSLAFPGVVAANGRVWWINYQRRWLHSGCPFPGCACLLRQAAGKPGEESWPPAGCLHTHDACLYAGLPLSYMVVPVLIQLLVLRSLGSLVASTTASASLSLGWRMRMFERFCLDGWTPMTWIERQTAKMDFPPDPPQASPSLTWINRQI